MLAEFGPQEMIIILVIVLVLFGGTQLPKLARNLGRAQKEFKDGVEDGQRSARTTTTSPTATTTTTTARDDDIV